MPLPGPTSITAHWDSSQVRTLLAALEPRQWAFATALALTRTAQAVKAEERATLPRVFDRPTPFTRNSLRLQGATKTRQEARVWFKDPPRLTELEHYLLPQVAGGARPQKRFEATLQRAGLLRPGMALVPTKAAPLDAYGNVRRGIYARILANLRTSPVGANTPRGGRRGSGRAAKATFFFGDPGQHGRGIWQRSSTSIVPIFLETRMPQYRPRFAFFGIAEQVADARLGPEFDKAAAATLRSAR